MKGHELAWVLKLSWPRPLVVELHLDDVVKVLLVVGFFFFTKLLIKTIGRFNEINGGDIQLF